MHLMDFAVFTLGWLGGVWAGIWWVTKTEDNKETRDHE